MATVTAEKIEKQFKTANINLVKLKCHYSEWQEFLGNVDM